MTRAVNLCLWFLFGFLAAAAPMFAQAEGTITISGGQVIGTVQYTGFLASGTSVKGPTRAAVCSGFAAANPYGWPNIQYSYVAGTGQCFIYNGSWWPEITIVSDPSTPYCASGVVSGSNCISEQQACPANSTGPVGNVCTCNLGYDPVNGQCNSRTCTAGQDVGALTSQTLSSCFNGCRTTGTGTTCTASGCVTYGNTKTGLTCDTANNVPTAPTSAASCAAQGKGWAEVNGVVSCSQNQTTTTKVDSKTTTNPDGSTSTEQTKTTVDNTTGQTTTEKTTGGTDSTGTPLASGTTTTQQNNSKFCQDNPDSPMCKAVDPCEENPDLVSCLEVGEGETVADLQTKNVGSGSINPVAVGGSGSCPPPRTFTAMGQTIAIPLDQMCAFAGYLKPFILAAAWLSALGILVGAFRSES